MNSLLKLLLSEVATVVQSGEDIAKKDWSGLFAALVAGGENVPSIVTGWADLEPELAKLLADPAADADLLAYVGTLFSAESAEAKLIIAASCKLALDAALDVSALISAVKGVAPKAPAA